MGIVLHGKLMPALDTTKLLAHYSTLRLVAGALVLEALCSPVLWPDIECSMARLMLQNEAILDIWLCTNSQEVPHSDTYSLSRPYPVICGSTVHK